MKTTLVLVVLAFAALLMLAVLASIRHPISADQIQIESPMQQSDPPTS
jgi:hypothetical protein